MIIAIIVCAILVCLTVMMVIERSVASFNSSTEKCVIEVKNLVDDLNAQDAKKYREEQNLIDSEFLKTKTIIRTIDIDNTKKRKPRKKKVTIDNRVLDIS